MEVFQQLRQLYVTVNNDLRSLQQMTNRPVQGVTAGSNPAQDIVNNLLSDVQKQKGEIDAKQKELQGDTRFCEVVASAFELINYNVQRLEEVEFHLQKYCPRPNANATGPNVQSAPLVVKSSVEVLATPKVSDRTTVVVPPRSIPPVSHVYDLTHTPNPADFGITERTFQHLDEVRSFLEKLQNDPPAKGQGRGKEEAQICGISSSDSSFPSKDLTVSCNPNLHPDLTYTIGSFVDLSVKESHTKSISGHDLVEGGRDAATIGTDFAAAKNNEILFLDGTTLPKSTPQPYSRSVLQDINKTLDFSEVLSTFKMPSSPPKLSADTLNILGPETAEKRCVMDGSHSAMSDTLIDSDDVTSFLSERTLNLLRQFHLAKVPDPEVKGGDFSGREVNENVPPKGTTAPDPVARRRIDLENRTGEKVSLPYPMSTDAESGISKTDLASKNLSTSTRSVSDAAESSRSVSDAAESTRSFSVGSDFGAADPVCTQMQPFSSFEYENCLPESVRNTVPIDQINALIEKTNRIIRIKRSKHEPATISSVDLTTFIRDAHAELFLKLMARSKRLVERSSDGATRQYEVI